jgi:hypothetical protein
MKHEIGKGLFITAGMLLLTTGLGLGGYGAWLMTHLDEPVDQLALRGELTEQCKALSLKEGYRVVHKGADLTLADTGLEDHESKLHRASWVTQACEGFVMTKFCMGEECSQQAADQFSITLSYSEEAVRAPQKVGAAPAQKKSEPASAKKKTASK